MSDSKWFPFLCCAQLYDCDRFFVFFSFVFFHGAIKFVKSASNFVQQVAVDIRCMLAQDSQNKNTKIGFTWMWKVCFAFLSLSQHLRVSSRRTDAFIYLFIFISSPFPPFNQKSWSSLNFELCCFVRTRNNNNEKKTTQLIQYGMVSFVRRWNQPTIRPRSSSSSSITVVYEKGGIFKRNK